MSTSFAFTSISYVPLFPLPSAAVAVITILPAVTPSISTVPFSAFSVNLTEFLGSAAHVTFLFVAVSGVTFAVRVIFSPIFTIFSPDIVTFSTGTVSGAFASTVITKSFV